MTLTKELINQLIENAYTAYADAYCPISHHPVGAAVLTESGEIISGANVETSISNVGMCAERMALFSAFISKHQKIRALALVTDDGEAPCGTCRQAIEQLCGNIPIIIAKTDKAYLLTSTACLIPSTAELHSCGSSIV